MKIAVFGAGALGCYFGGRLLEAGHEVSFIARGTHLEALRDTGLIIESPLGDAWLDVEASDDPADIGEVDLVLFLVKLYDTDAGAAALGPLLGPDTGVANFQNGVDGWDRLAAAVGPERVFGGSAYIFAEVTAPGVVRHSGAMARLVFGEPGGEESPRVRALADALTGSGVEHEVVDNILVRVWEKFVFLSALSGVTSLTRLPLGPILADEPCAALFAEALDETARVGLARCPGLGADIAERQLAFAKSLPATMRSSMLGDLERGRRLELDHLSGEVARLGAELGIDTPVHCAIHRALHPYVQGAPPG